MLGGKFRDRVRIYADTDESPDPKVFAQRLKARKEEMGITWLKMDVGINLVEEIPGTGTGPSELTAWERRALPHPFVATEVTEKGIEKLSEFVQAAGEAVGREIPLSMDHLGHLGLGITHNQDVVRRHLAPGTDYFEPTPQWNQERSGDWLWSM